MECDGTELLAIAVSVARPAAELAREMRVSGVGDVTTKSTETDVVTAADQAVERQVRDALAAARPFDQVLGEEFGDAPRPGGRHGLRGDGASQGADGRSAVRWILDPIDGTVNYLYGLRPYAVSLAAEIDGEVVAGVVIDAATGEEWTATKGGGAFAAGRRLSGSGQQRLSQALVGTGFAYTSARRAHQAQVLAGLLMHIRDIRRFGSAAVDLCYVADGRLDAFYEKGLNAWDHAAGGLVAREAGVLVSGSGGAPAGPDLVVAAPPGLHEQLLGYLERLDAAGGP
jgi:myo-inositol-1(or 4)-monophosphatase